MRRCGKAGHTQRAVSFLAMGGTALRAGGTMVRSKVAERLMRGRATGWRCRGLSAVVMRHAASNRAALRATR
jgi:hypothetical protein